MDNFAALYGSIESLTDFQEADFNKVWEFSLTDLELSAEERELFPDSTDTKMTAINPAAVFNFEDRNPLLTSTALDDIPMVFASNDEELITGDEIRNSPSEIDFDTLLDLPPTPYSNVPDDTVLPDPTTDTDNITIFKEEPLTSSEEIMEIHSYCQPAPSSPIPTEITYKPVTSAPIRTEIKITKKETTKKVNRALNQVKTGRVIKRQVKPKKQFDESSDDESDYEDHKVKSKSSRSSGRKQKLYEMGEFKDPAMEQKRINAINAKRNRDRKRKEKNSLEKSMSILRQENERLKKKNVKYLRKMTTFEARLQALETIIQMNPQLESQIKASGNGEFLKSFTNVDGCEDQNSSSSDGEESEEVIIYDDSD